MDPRCVRGWGGVGGHGAGATFNRRNPQVHCPPFVAAGTLSGGWGGPAEAGGGGGIRRGNDGAVVVDNPDEIDIDDEGDMSPEGGGEGVCGNAEEIALDDDDEE